MCDQVDQFINDHPDLDYTIPDLQTLITWIMTEKSLPSGLTLDEIFEEVKLRKFQFPDPFDFEDIQMFCICANMNLMACTEGVSGIHYLNRRYMERNIEMFPRLLPFEKELIEVMKENPKKPYMKWCEKIQDPARFHQTRMMVELCMKRVKILQIKESIEHKAKKAKLTVV